MKSVCSAAVPGGVSAAFLLSAATPPFCLPWGAPEHEIDELVPRLPSDLCDMHQRFPLMDQGIDTASNDHPGKAGLDLPGLLAQGV